MSFYRDNKYFIERYLQVGMKNLSTEKRQSKYNEISSEVRSRIYKSYPKNKKSSGDVENSELNIFYKELFEYLGEFELNYIIANLFFEKYFPNIVYYLKNNSSVLTSLISPPFQQFTFKWFFYNYLKEENCFQSYFLNFLKKTICENTSLSLPHLEVRVSKSGNYIFEFTHSYPKWLIANLNDQSKAHFIHLLVLKFFNIELIFIDHNNSGKFVISFLNYLSKNYDEAFNNGQSPELYHFYKTLNSRLESLFIKNFILKTPILDNKEREIYSSGFYIQKENFLAKVKEAEILNNEDLHKKKYKSLIRLYFTSGNNTKLKIKNSIIKKLSSFEYLTEEDIVFLSELKQYESYPEFNTFINSRFYRF